MWSREIPILIQIAGIHRPPAVRYWRERYVLKL